MSLELDSGDRSTLTSPDAPQLIADQLQRLVANIGLVEGLALQTGLAGLQIWMVTELFAERRR
jgi:hypothetical protein